MANRMTGKHAAQTSAIGNSTVRAKFFAPPPEFDGCFTTFYLLELDVVDGGKVSDYLQPEWANIRFFSGATPWVKLADGEPVENSNFTATGPSIHPAEFALGSARMWGIGILPLGWARLIDGDAADMANLVLDGYHHPAFQKFAAMSEVLCDPERSEQEQLEYMASAMRALMRPNRDEAKILRVHTCLVDAKLTSVAEFADRTGMSMRTLERICRRYFGFPPKLLMRRQRFMRSLTAFLLQKGGSWTDAMDEEYYDQAQFTREFRQFMRMKPSEYAALDHPVLSAFMKARAEIWGSAAQTLDRPGRKS